jgi:hypothetical protein
MARGLSMLSTLRSIRVLAVAGAAWTVALGPSAPMRPAVAIQASRPTPGIATTAPEKLPVSHVHALAQAGAARMVVGRKPGTTLLAASLSRGGHAFGSPTVVDPATGDGPARIAGTTHRFYVVWTHHDRSAATVYVRVYVIGDGWRPKQALLTTSGGSAPHGYPVTRPNGRVAVVLPHAIAVRQAGGGWSMSAPIGPGELNGASITDAGQLVALTRQRVSSTGDRLVVLTSPDSSSWTTLKTLVDGTHSVQTQRLAVNGIGAISVAWAVSPNEFDPPTAIRTWTRAGTASHRTITSSLPVSAAELTLGALTLGDHLRAMVLWSEVNDSPHLRIRVAVIDDGVWTRPTTIRSLTLPDEEALNAEVTFHVAANRVGDVWAVMSYDTLGEDTLYYETESMHLTNNGTVVSRTSTFDMGGQEGPPIVSVAVATTDAGTVAWNERQPTSHVVRYSS